MLRTSTINIVAFFGGIVGVWLVIFLVTRREDFAGLICGLASIPMVLALAKGTLQYWRSNESDLRADEANARRITQQASRCAMAIAVLGAIGLGLVMPGTWTAWSLLLAWACFAGMVFFVVFRTLNRELGRVG